MTAGSTGADARVWLLLDYLRLHPEEPHQYDILKRELVQKFGTNRQGYVN